ncbi:MAG TPA: enoyl-CoA hydratase/isomerase family protein [Pseudonocardiaceae bacterium]|jgi:enoyl-CoA hydratase/carnithine racemase|nr:enoyl-CoA hydratase/isomerase family protein [Pseudonocardiaceae bacterium]
MGAEADAELLRRGAVRFAVDGELATVTLDRPDALNAQTPSTWDALAHIGSRLAADVRVVVVRGAGRSFSAGLDRRMFGPEGVPGDPGLPALTEGSTADADLMLRRFQDGFAWLTDPRRVTVAAVQGHAIGAGFQLALACDLRLAAEDAQFSMAETTLGLVPDLGGTLPLVRAVGYARAVEICLTGRRVPAAEALRIGLVNDVVPVEGLDDAVDELVGRLRKPLAGATQETLALLAAASDGPTFDQQRAAERAAQLRRLADLRKAFGG